jgi:hypothetical protein
MPNEGREAVTRFIQATIIPQLRRTLEQYSDRIVEDSIGHWRIRFCVDDVNRFEAAIDDAFADFSVECEHFDITLEVEKVSDLWHVIRRALAGCLTDHPLYTNLSIMLREINTRPRAQGVALTAEEIRDHFEQCYQFGKRQGIVGLRVSDAVSSSQFVDGSGERLVSVWTQSGATHMRNMRQRPLSFFQSLVIIPNLVAGTNQNECFNRVLGDFCNGRRMGIVYASAMVSMVLSSYNGVDVDQRSAIRRSIWQRHTATNIYQTMQYPPMLHDMMLFSSSLDPTSAPANELYAILNLRPVRTGELNEGERALVEEFLREHAAGVSTGLNIAKYIARNVFNGERTAASVIRYLNSVRQNFVAAVVAEDENVAEDNGDLSDNESDEEILPTPRVIQWTRVDSEAQFSEGDEIRVTYNDGNGVRTVVEGHFFENYLRPTRVNNARPADPDKWFKVPYFSDSDSESEDEATTATATTQRRRKPKSRQHWFIERMEKKQHVVDKKKARKKE